MLNVIEYRNPDNPKQVTWEVWKDNTIVLDTTDILEASSYLMNCNDDFTLEKKERM